MFQVQMCQVQQNQIMDCIYCISKYILNHLRGIDTQPQYTCFLSNVKIRYRFTSRTGKVNTVLPA